MTDHEIHECIDNKNSQLLHDVTKVIEGFTSSMTLLITTENQNIKHSIDQLTARVGMQNGRVGKSEDRIVILEKWQSGHQGYVEGRTSQWEKNWKVWLGVLTLVGTMGGIFFGMHKIVSAQKDLKTQVDYINSPVINERGEVVLYPSGVLMDSLKNVKK